MMRERRMKGRKDRRWQCVRRGREGRKEGGGVLQMKDWTALE